MKVYGIKFEGEDITKLFATLYGAYKYLENDCKKDLVNSADAVVSIDRLDVERIEGEARFFAYDTDGSRYLYAKAEVAEFELND